MKSTHKPLKITLILTANSHDALAKRSPFMPLSLPILASLAPEHDYEFIDMFHESAKINFDTDSDIIGISLRQSAEETAFKLADEFRSKGKFVVLGGAQASARPFAAKEHADTVVVGEAENIWKVFLSDFASGNTKDFYVCSPNTFDSKEFSLYQTETLPDLQNLPTPARRLLKKKYTFDVTYASRGCPISCDFCLVSDLYGKKLRFRPIEQVVAEIKSFRKFYYLLDDTIFGRANCYDYYLDLYKQIAKLPKVNLWTGQANLDAAATKKGQEVIRMAAKAGLSYAAIGIESINIDTLKTSGAYTKMGVNEPSDAINRMKENIAFIQNQGIVVSGWFTIGYETDSVQTYYDSLKFCEEMNILPVFSPIRALPGSQLWKRLESEGKIKSKGTGISNIEQSHQNEKEIAIAILETAHRGYSAKANIKRLKYFYTLFRKTEKNLNAALYKTIFAHITQKRMGKIVKEESKHMTSRII